MENESTPDNLLLQYQIALFPNNFAVDSWYSLFNKIVTTWSKYNFSDKSNYNALPNNLPTNIFRLNLISSDEKFKIDISSEKMDLVWSRKITDTHFKINQPTIMEDLNYVLDLVYKDITFKRVGFIVDTFINKNLLEVPPTNKIINTLYTKNLERFESTFTYSFDINNYKCFYVLTTGEGEVYTDTSQALARGYLLRGDINTQPQINIKADKKIFSTLIPEFISRNNEEILKNYLLEATYGWEK